VLIGSPIHEHKEYVVREFLDNVRTLEGDFDFVAVDNTRLPDFASKLKTEYPDFWFERVPWCSNAFYRMVLSYNKIREIAMNGGYDYLLTLECDVFPPKDIIPKFIGYNKKVVAGVYPINITWKTIHTKDKQYYCVWRPSPHKMMPCWMTDDDLGQGLVKWDGGFSYGCCLFDISVFDDFIFRESNQRCAAPDGAGYEDLHNAGIETYISTGAVCGHKYGDWVKVGKLDEEEAKYVREFRKEN